MNILSNIFFRPKAEVFKVKTEDELLTKLDECIKKVLKNQKVEITFKSSYSPQFSETVKFGYREGNSFNKPDLSIKFIIDPISIKNLPKNPLEVSYDTKEHVSSVDKGAVSIKRMSYSNSKYGIRGDEKVVSADHNQLKENGSLEFWKTVKKFPVDSKDRLLTSVTSEKIQSLIISKLKEISPIMPPKEFGEDVSNFFRRLFSFAS